MNRSKISRTRASTRAVALTMLDEKFRLCVLRCFPAPPTVHKPPMRKPYSEGVTAIREAAVPRVAEEWL